MPIASTEKLFKLIKSMTKSEKRTFKLYANRNKGDGDLLFLRLFDAIDKQNDFNEALIKSKLGSLTTGGYSNLKRRLYEQIMISLRLLHKGKLQNIKIRELIDFAYVLYGKGLHMQALEILEKAKILSQKHHNDFSLLIIIELEKMIQSRHITRSKSEPILTLMQESELLNSKITSRIKLSNIRIHLHKLYIEKGHVINKKEESELQSYFSTSMEEVREKDLDGMELIYFYQSYVWYHYILDDFDQCIIYAKKWVELFKESNELQSRDIDLFMRGYHYILTAAFHMKDAIIYQKYLDELEVLRSSQYSKLNLNSQIVSFQYVHNGRMNLHFLNGTFAEGLKNIPNTIKRINRYKSKLDAHKVMIIYYKVSWMYIGNGEAKKSIKYLQNIINLTDKSLRIDIQSYSRLMLLIAFYDLREDEAFEQNYKLTKRYFKKHNNSNQVQVLILTMLNKVMFVGQYDRKAIFESYFQEFTRLKENRFEKRAFIYLDILPWIYSKIKRVELGKAVQKIDH